MTTTMFATMTTRAAALALTGATMMVAAGCGSSSSASCEQAVANATRLRNLGESEARISLLRCQRESWSGELRSCAAGAKSADALDRCAARRSRDSASDFDSYMKKSKRSEAELQLKVLEKTLRTGFYENASFPIGDTGPTPAAGSCCEGPDHKCAPDPSLWSGDKVWSALDFSIDEPSYYSYAYRSADGQRATVQVIGDLDCDSILATYTLECEVVAGEPRCSLLPPAPGAD